MGDERERSLLGAEVGKAQGGVGVEHHAEVDVGEVVALGDHLGADQHARRGVLEAGEQPRRRRSRAPSAGDGVGVEPENREIAVVEGHAEIVL